ncbi:MAG: PGPGW domain-containing protein [Limisphaerales bacterium]
MSQKSQRGLRYRIRKILHLEDAPPFVRRVIIAVIGGTILLIGVAMIVLPGPAVVVIPLGLAVLATEFIWARRWLRKARKMFKQAKDRVTGASNKKPSA